MYDKFNATMKTGVRDEAEYVKVGLEEAGETYLNDKVGNATDTRITLTDEKGNVLYDSEADATRLPNHSDRPEFVQAMEDGQGESVRYSETLAQQTFYYAVKLSDGKILRLAKTTDQCVSYPYDQFYFAWTFNGTDYSCGIWTCPAADKETDRAYQ